MSIVQKVVDKINTTTIDMNSIVVGSFEVFTRERQDNYNCLFNLNNLNILNNFSIDIKHELCWPNTTVCKTLIGTTSDGYIIFSYKGYYILVHIQNSYAMAISNSFIIRILVFRNLEDAEDEIEYYEADYESYDDEY